MGQTPFDCVHRELSEFRGLSVGSGIPQGTVLGPVLVIAFVNDHDIGWLRSFLTERKQRVTVNGSFSEWAAVDSGIPQGTVLGPVLFIAFVNDVHLRMQALR